MRAGAKVFSALDGDLEPLLACGWLLSMTQGIAVVAGPSERKPGAGPAAHGFMDPHVLRQDRDEEVLLQAAAAHLRRVAAALPGDGALQLVHGPPVGNFDLLLVGRPPFGRPLSSSPAYWNADAQRFKAVLVAPRETPSCLSRSVTILANGPPREPLSFGIARRLFPALASVRLILDHGSSPEQESEWLRLIDCHCPVQVSTVRRTADPQSAALPDAKDDLLIVERPVGVWAAISFEWRLTGLLERTPGAVLFTL
ncbi:hypothetical protein [Azospirillum sp. B506]|uniref:hypothetical protein n=1 Tax=Azospirillum sp. B506 TaxID=137721 RepID=UPI00034D8CCF|nr:hypothetical protein [Azospirillum sp. B506]